MWPMLRCRIIKQGILYVFPVFFTFFNTSKVLAQEVSKKSVIVDSETKQPIPFCNIILKGKTSGTYSNNEGVFTITGEQKDSLLISSIGYDVMLISLNILGDTLRLNPTSTTLSEITVKAKSVKISTQKLGYYSDKTIGHFARAKDVALYIENPYNIPISIKNVDFRFSRIKFGSNNSTKKIKNKEVLLRLNIYENLDDSKPQKNLINQNIIQKLPKNRRSISFDISESNVILPEKGAFISIEFLGHMEDDIFIPYSKKQTNGIVQFAPAFSRNHKKANSWYKVDYDSKWRQFNAGMDPYYNFNFSVEIQY